jgi:CubicO group peptidase (beta-lactamase class C family)
MRTGRLSGSLLGIALVALIALVILGACHGEAPPAASSTATSNAAAAPAAGANPGAATGVVHPTDDDLVGLWKAKRRFGPDARGPLVLRRGPEGWTADFLGRLRPVGAERSELTFELPDGEGSFHGHLAPGDRRILGHWTSAPSVIHGSRFAVPVVLEADGPERWRGQVAPLDDTFTLYLMVSKRPDGTLGAFLRNPERNIGVRYDVDRLVRDGGTVKLVGRRGRSPAESTLLSGTYDADNATLTIAFPDRGGTYDFRRDGEHSEFYPRGKHPERYVYHPPPALDDGWRTGTLDEVGISRPGSEAFIQTLLDMPIESVHAPEVHGVLVARHGKLVLEEYFHGESRDRLHDTRSAAKSLTATVAGAAIQAGAPLGLSTPVYAIMNDGVFPADLDPRKRTMTLEHLLMMRSGFFCDDANPDAPGNEDAMTDQTAEPDYYRYSLKVPLANPPGETSVYCSMSPNLALGTVGRATGESVLDTFDRLVGGPLRFARYAWPLDPAGHPYGGGGVRALPRDFMKLGQLMLDGGAWNGQRILGRDFVERASSPLHDLNGIQYGYLWWSIEYPYKHRKVRAFFAAGNGGQAVMVIPALDLVIAIYAGNFSDRTAVHVQQDLVPSYVLPAVREPGDDPGAPVVPLDFATPYGPPRAPAR